MAEEKWHINNKGEARICKARFFCLFGSLENSHYPSRTEAQLAFEKTMAGKELQSKNKGEPTVVEKSEIIPGQWEQPKRPPVSMFNANMDLIMKLSNSKSNNERVESLEEFEYYYSKENFKDAMEFELKKKLFEEKKLLENEAEDQRKHKAMYDLEKSTARKRGRSSQPLRNEKRKEEEAAEMAKASKANLRIGSVFTTNDPVLLDKLSRDKVEAVRVAVAKKEKTPQTILDRLSKDSSLFVQRAVARNINTPPETIAVLADSENHLVRAAAAQSETLSQEKIGILSKDKSPQVRAGAARNTNIYIGDLNRLSREKSIIVRMGVLDNHKTPSPVLKEMYSSALINRDDEKILGFISNRLKEIAA